MSRDKSRGCSDHQVINTVNNPVETHTAAGPRPVVACRRRGRPLWGPRRLERAWDARHRLEVLGRRSLACPPNTVLWTRSADPLCDLPPEYPRCRAGAGLVPPGTRQQALGGQKLSTYTQGNPQKLSTGVEIGSAAWLAGWKIASPGGQSRVVTVNYTLVSY
jgi:hypothetical protein